MNPKISVITLIVRDFQKSVAFYRDGLKFPVESDNENIVFFKLENIILGIYPIEAFEKTEGVGEKVGTGFGGFTMAHNVASESEVDETIEFARSAGAEIVKEAEEVFWGGYSGYFKDPDGNLWEVAYNPHNPEWV